MIPTSGAISVVSWDTFHATAPIRNLAIKDHQHPLDHDTVGIAVVAGIAILGDVLDLDQEIDEGHDQDHNMVFSRASIRFSKIQHQYDHLIIILQFGETVYYK